MPADVALTLTDPDHEVTFDRPFGSVTEAREIPVRLFAPETPGRYPLVLYSHGHLGQPSGPASIHAAAIAEAGYVVAVPTHLDSTDNAPGMAQFPFTPQSTLHRVADLQHIASSAEDLETALPGYEIDAAAPVVAGHSHGARTALLLAGAAPGLPEFTDLAPDNPYGLAQVALPSAAGVIAISPPEPGDGTSPGFEAGAWEALDVPSLWITGTEDVVFDGQIYRDRLLGYDEAPVEQKVAFVIEGADHAALGGRDAAPATLETVAGLAIDFLDETLAGTGSPVPPADPQATLARLPALSEAYLGDRGVLEPVDGAAIGRGPSHDTLLLLDTPLSVPQPEGAEFRLETGADAPLRLASVERILFEEGTLVLDGSGEAEDVFLFFQTVYDRVPQPDGLGFWTGVLSDGAALTEIADAFIDTPEYLELYGDAASDEAYVAALFENALGRAPAAEGAAYWADALASGTLDRGDMLVAFALSDEIRALFDDETAPGLWALE